MRPLNRYQQSKLETAFLRATREDARKSQASYCFYCDEPLTAKSATADHRQARAHFGMDHRNNIVASCGPCNRLKACMAEAEFRRRIEAPRRGEPIAFWLAWSRRRINKRLRLMEKRLRIR